MKNILKKIMYMLLLSCILCNNIFATSRIIEETSEALDLNSMIDTLNEYKDESQLGEELDLEDISKNLITGKNNNYSKLIQKLIDIFAGESKCNKKCYCNINYSSNNGNI